MLSTVYQPLSEKFPEWGTIAILPWDSEIFGFPVADYQMGDPKEIARSLAAWLDVFGIWTRERRVELVSCNIPADDPLLRALSPRIGFIFIDLALQVSLTKPLETPPDSLTPVELAQPSDQADLERIAEGAFRFGRYHSDPYFPSELADRRYREWVRSALSGSSPDNVMYVIRRAGRAAGLSHVEFEGTRGHLTIIAVERSAQSQDIGQALGNMMRSDFHRRGLKEVWSQVSAINSQVLNFALPRGYRALKPQVIYHWHAPQAPHLVPWEKIYA